MLGSYEKFNTSVFMGETAPILAKAIQSAQDNFNGDATNSCSDACSLKSGLMVLQEAVGIKDIKAAADEAHTSAGAAKAEAAEAKSQATKALATALSSGTEKIRADILTNAEQLDVLRRSLDALSVQVKSLTSPPTAATATPVK